MAVTFINRNSLFAGEQPTSTGGYVASPSSNTNEPAERFLHGIKRAEATVNAYSTRVAQESNVSEAAKACSLSLTKYSEQTYYEILDGKTVEANTEEKVDAAAPSMRLSAGM